MDEQDEQATVTEVPLKCLSCNVDTEVYYGVPFKIGRSDPAARLLLGWVSELGEDPILIDPYVYPKCGRLQQFVNQKTRERLRRSLTLKQ